MEKGEDEVKSPVYYVYVLLALNHHHIVIGCYLFVAGAVAMLLSLVFLSVISCVLLRRDTRYKGRTFSTTASRDSPEDTYTSLQTVDSDGQHHKDSISTCTDLDNNYARPFMPVEEIRLNRHCLISSQDHSCTEYTHQSCGVYTTGEMAISYCDLDELRAECMHMFNPPSADRLACVEESEYCTSGAYESTSADSIRSPTVIVFPVVGESDNEC